MSRKALAMPDNAPFWERFTTFGRTMDGQVTFVQNSGDKQDLLRTALDDMKKGAVFFWVWPGQWTTNLFSITENDVLKLLL